MGLPIFIDVLSHLQHATGNHFRVHAVVGKVFQIVAIAAALFR